MLTSSIKNGLINGLKTCWFLIKIIIPVYLFITILKNTPAMDWLTTACAPLMGLFHMPGEAAVPLITGFILDEYGLIAAIKAVDLTGFSVVILAVMVLISHSLFVEAAIVKKMSLSATFFTLYRLSASLIMGFALSIAGTVFSLW